MAARGGDGGSTGTGARWRRRQAAWRHASEQKRRRPTGRTSRPESAQAVVTPTLRDGAVTTVPLSLAGLALRQGAPEAEGLGAGLDDVGAVGDAVEQCLAEPGVGDDLGPLRERQVGRQDDRGPLGPLGDDLEQELGADLGDGGGAD